MEQSTQPFLRAASRARREAVTAVTTSPDPRWRVLGHIQMAKRELGISDREISVLRGLLTFVSAGDWGKAMIVFASNRVLAERCDAVDERTLRRRLVRLELAGLVVRRASPSGKRYRVKDETGAPALTFGIDLTPLAELSSHIEALADSARTEAIRCRVLRARIRQRLEDLADGPSLMIEREAARLALRRVLNAEALAEVFTALEDGLLATPEQPVMADQFSDAADLSVRSSQNVRQYQKSDKDHKDLKMAEKTKREAASITPKATHRADLTIQDCIEAASTAAEFAVSPLRSWDDLTRLADGLAPAIGIDNASLSSARRAMGELGSTLAILGLTQALGRVRRPAAYLSALAQEATVRPIDPVRMFRSLTASPICAVS